MQVRFLLGVPKNRTYVRFFCIRNYYLTFPLPPANESSGMAVVIGGAERIIGLVFSLSLASKITASTRVGDLPC